MATVNEHAIERAAAGLEGSAKSDLAEPGPSARIPGRGRDGYVSGVRSSLRLYDLLKRRGRAAGRFRRSDLEVFLSANTRKTGRGRGRLETERDSST